jgi:predicted nucleic acid-binding OB-fold protein
MQQTGLSQQRSDEHSSTVVDRGISVQSSFNTVCAIEYMKSHNVAPQVIERVLLHPEQRRKIQH